MVGRWTFCGCILTALSITSTQSADNAMQGEIMITDSKSMKTLEVRNTSNATSTLPASPTVIQQGNNVFIKPKFIYGSPFTSCKQGCSKSDSISVISNVPEKETELPLPPRFPILDERPVRPLTIPKPPELPPLILPKLPIQVIIQRPQFRFPNPPFIKPIPDRLVIFQPLCTMIQRISPERTGSNFFSGIFEKLKNLPAISSKIDLSRLFIPDESILEPDLPAILPTLSAQSIIAERFVPNIVSVDNNVKVFMSPVFPDQLEYFGGNRK